MIINSVHFTFAPNDADHAEALLKELRDASRQEPGVMQFDVGRSVDKPTVFAIWEVYRDQAALDAHDATEHFQRILVKEIRPLLQARDFYKVAPL